MGWISSDKFTVPPHCWRGHGVEDGALAGDAGSPAFGAGGADGAKRRQAGQIGAPLGQLGPLQAHADFEAEGFSVLAGGQIDYIGQSIPLRMRWHPF
jgi:hypothetical protein